MTIASLNARWGALGAAALVLVGGVVYAISTRGHSNAPAAKPTLTADATGVTLAADAPQWKYVELAVAKQAAPLAPLPAPGRVAFDDKRTANVGTPLMGRIETVMVRLGDTVKQGDRLFSVRSGAYAELDRELASAHEAVAVKRRIAERAKDLFALKAGPEKEVLSAEAEVKEAELMLKAAQAKHQSLSVQQGGDNLFWVRSPRAGTVVELDAYGSQEVTPEREKPIVRITELDEVLVLADMQESDASDLKTGSAVIIRSQAGTLQRPGVVDHVSEIVDPNRRSVEVRVRAKNADHALRPNAFVEIELASEGVSDRVRVPAEAVVSEGPKSMVFVARGPGRLESVPVVIGRRRDGEVEVKEGLEPGSRFVSKGALLLLNQVELAN